MSINLEFGGIELTGDPQRQRSTSMRDAEGSVRIGVIGDFRGRVPASGRTDSHPSRTLSAPGRSRQPRRGPGRSLS